METHEHCPGCGGWTAPHDNVPCRGLAREPEREALRAALDALRAIRSSELIWAMVAPATRKRADHLLAAAPAPRAPDTVEMVCAVCEEVITDAVTRLGPETGKPWREALDEMRPARGGG